MIIATDWPIFNNKSGLKLFSLLYSQLLFLFAFPLPTVNHFIAEKAGNSSKRI